MTQVPRDSLIEETWAAKVLEPLLSPFSVSSLNLRNRFALAPMTRLKAVDGTPTPTDADYYRRRAAGGAGLIITEGTLIPDAAAGFSRRIPVLVGEAETGWRPVIDVVHAEGSAIVAQLWHTGISRGVRSKHNPGVPPRSPSGLSLAGKPVSEPMAVEDIDQVIAAYAQGAAAAKAWGFDGVELHGAHGYLLDQFLWSRTNIRIDRFGRSSGHGTQFPVEVVRAVRDVVGDDFAVIYRFSQWKTDHYSARIAETPGELEALLMPLVEAGVDILHPSTRRHWLPEFSEEGELSLAGWTKKLTGLPTIAVGSIGIEAKYGGTVTPAVDTPLIRLEKLRDQFLTGEFDIAAIGRAMLADAEWISKMINGRTGEIRPYRKIPETETLDYERSY
jgi:2,4-dienoyl-CoA reductase-like NADH-dependent reductase (Old Yellow Enzyme family)